MTSERDVEATKQRLIQAVLRVLGGSGFAELGVNRVAREAGVDKVLIYRYFDGLDGLVRAAAASADFWPTYEELVGDLAELEALPAGRLVATVLRRYAKGLQERPLALEILAWETVSRTAHTAAFESVREELSLRLGALLAGKLQATAVDAPALITLLAAAVNYLCIRRRSIRVFNDVEIGSDAGWCRLERTIELVCARLLDPSIPRP